MLSALGLNPNEEAAYRALVVFPSLTAMQLAHHLDRGPAQVATVLAVLEERGLANRSLADLDSYVAVAPEVALKGTLVERQADLNRAATALEELAALYRQAPMPRSSTDVIDVIYGLEAVRLHTLKLQDGAERELLNLIKSPTIISPELFESAQDAASQRGVHYRVVVDAAIFEGGSDYVPHPAEQTRVVAEVPTKLIVADRSLGLVPLADRPGDLASGGLLIHPSGILDALLGLFEVLFSIGKPLNDHPDVDGLTPAEGRVLELLAAGLTDRAIAGLLKISERSVQRHVKTLMDKANARSRVQLGIHAATHDWLPG